MGVHTDAPQLTPLLTSGYWRLPLHIFSALNGAKDKRRKRGKYQLDRRSY